MTEEKTSPDMKYPMPDKKHLKPKIKKLLGQDTIPDGKQALMIIAEEVDKLNDKIERLKRRIR